MIECAYNVLAARLDVYVPCLDLHQPGAMNAVFDALNEAMDMIERQVGDTDVHYFSIRTVSKAGKDSLAQRYDPMDVGTMAFWVRAGTDPRHRMRAIDWLLRIEDVLTRARRYNRKKPGLWEATNTPFGQSTARVLSSCHSDFQHYVDRLEALWSDGDTPVAPAHAPAARDDTDKMVLNFRSVG